MRIRKRTPARAATPGPSPPLSSSPPPSLLLPKELPREEKENEAEEVKRVVLPTGDHEGGPEDGRHGDGVVVPLTGSAASDKNSAADRCSRNDGKRWRCKNAAVPGSPFCDRHVQWSTRPRQTRATKKQKQQQQSRRKKKQQQKQDGGGGGGGSVSEPAPVPAEEDEEHADGKDIREGEGEEEDGFYYYYGGFQPGGGKRARGDGPGPAGGGGVNQQQEQQP